YVFSVAAINGLGTGMLASVQARVPTPPSPPGNVHCTGSARAISVTWAPPVDDGGSRVAGYKVVATPPVGPAVQASAPDNATSATVGGLANGVTYACTVIASNVVGDSSPSAPDQAKTDNGAPSAPRNLTGVPG